MLFHYNVLLALNPENSYLAANLSGAQQLTRGGRAAAGIDFSDDEFSNATHFGSMFVYNPSDSTMDYHGNPFAKLVFARASNAYYHNSSGYLVLAQANVPRQDYNPTTLECEGIALEGNCVNLLSNTDTFTGWTTSNTFLTANAMHGPFNTSSLSKLIANNVSASHTLTFNISGQNTASNLFCFSIYAKAGEYKKLHLAVYEANTLTRNFSARYELDTGQIIQRVGSSSANVHVTEMTAYPNGIYRLNISGKLGGTDTGVQVRLSMIDNANASTFSSNGTAGVYIGHAQLETAEHPSSYVPSGTSGSNTRLSETMWLPISTIPYSNSEGTVMVEAKNKNHYVNNAATAGSNRVLYFYTNATHNYSIGRIATPFYDPADIPQVDTLGALGNSTVNSSWNTHNLLFETKKHFKQAVSYKGANVSVSLNGAQCFGNVVTITDYSISNIVFASTNTTHGIIHGGSPMWVRRVAYFDEGYSNAKVMALASHQNLSASELIKGLNYGFASYDFSDDYFAAESGRYGSVLITDVPDSSYANVYVGPPHHRLTMVRSSTAAYVNSTGGIQFANANITRIGHHDSYTLENLGMLLERTGTNSCLWSADQTNAYYTAANVSLTANSVLAPDGTLTATRMTETTDAGSHGLSGTNIALAKNANLCFSTFVKDSNVGYVRLQLNGYNSNQFRADFDLSTYTVIANSTGNNGVFSNASIQRFPNGWVRLSIGGKCDSTDSATGVQPSLVFGSNSTNFSYTGDGASCLDTWGWQVEANTYCPTSYIPTTTATASRAAEQCVTGIANVPFNSSKGTLMVEFTRNDAQSNAQPLLTISNTGGSANTIYFTFGASNPAQLRFDIQTASSLDAQPTLSSSVGTNTVYKAIATWQDNDIRAYLKTGDTIGSIQTDTSVTIPTNLNIIRFGGATNSNTVTAYVNIKRVLYVNDVLSNSQMQTLLG